MHSSPSLRLMRLLAGGLLAAMGGVYFLAAARADNHGAWPYVAAFAEAALVGGLADWFAVTALFRRPLGLPIPHTAVIPRSKERIAQALGAFVADNFLSPAVVAERLKPQDLAGSLARRLADPLVAERLAKACLQAAPTLLSLLDDAAVKAFLARQLRAGAQDARLAGLLGQALQALAAQGRHQALIDAGLQEAARALADHAPAIRAKVRAKTDWFWRLLAADAKAAEALIASLEETIYAIAADPEHPARARITALIQDFANELQRSPALQAEVRAAAAALLDDPRLASVVDGFWAEARRRVAALSREEEDGAATSGLTEAVMRLGRGLEADPEVRDALNARLKTLLAELAGRHGPDAAGLIRDTIRGWDAVTMTAKLETQVGADLQYIRINGTLIGGLIGLGLHQLHVWFGF